MANTLTNRQQLERLKEPYRSQAFENCKTKSGNPKNWLEEESVNFKTTLWLAFGWGLTPEGDDYWKDIFANPENYTEQ